MPDESEMAKAVRSAVSEEIQRQSRPGGAIHSVAEGVGSNVLTTTLSIKAKGLLIFQIVLGFCAFMFAIDSQIIAIPGIPSKLAMWWPAMIPFITMLDRFCRLCGDWMDDGRINNSFKIAAVLIICGLATAITVGGMEAEPQTQVVDAPLPDPVFPPSLAVDTYPLVQKSY
jgi:hypothetical protein